MRSYASVEEIENGLMVCIVEENDEKTFKAYIPMEQIQQSINSVEEGDIIIVEHEAEQVIHIVEKDEAEKARRIEVIEQLESMIGHKE